MRCIIDTITNKMFRYKPYPLAQDAVRDFLQSHLNVSRSRFMKYWLNNGCDDFIPHPSMCPDDWRECARFSKSEEGNALSERMTHVRTCVGNGKFQIMESRILYWQMQARFVCAFDFFSSCIV